MVDLKHIGMPIHSRVLLGVPFSECLVIEDSVTAIALAKRNGAGRLVGIGETADGSELLALGADHYIHDFTEFDYGWLEN